MMARPFPSYTSLPKGQLEIQEIKQNIYRGIYTPPIEALPGRDPQPADYKRSIFDLNRTERLLTIYPYRVYSNQPMSAKYLTLNSISIELDWDDFPELNSENIDEFFEMELPEVVSADYNYGLGLKNNYRPIVSVLETMEIEQLFLVREGVTYVDLNRKKATIIYSDLVGLVKNIDRITQHAQKIAATVKRDSTTERLMQLFTNGTVEDNSKTEKASLARLLGKSTRMMPGGATKKEQKDALTVIANNSNRILYEQPAELMKLRNNIDLVSLEELIRRFEDMLEKKLTEKFWQNLLDQNPFILTMAFGIPIMKVHGQASVGGLKFTGGGNKIADYLVKNSISNNAAIVEIKTPATKLINQKEYRGGVFSPSIEITSAVNQVLDQIYLFQREINSLKANSGEQHLETYSVVGILIAGRFMTETQEQKSFELYRGNSKNVQIVTFDELLQKLKDLLFFLNPKTELKANSIIENNTKQDYGELPF